MIPRAAVLCTFAFALTACSHAGGFGTLPPGNVNFSSSVTRDAVSFKTIFTFNGTDGAAPSSTFITLNGLLYGTTSGGGKYNHGTIFTMSPSGTEKVLHDFNKDGQAPSGSLLALNGVLYGASQSVSSGSGEIFAIQTDGKSLWRYVFQGGWDGAGPRGGLTDLQGTLYGTTSGGGNYYKGAGTFFKITLSGKETVLRSFWQVSPDGADPNGNLVVHNGAFYGTTYGGGISNGFPGTVLRLTKTGGETVLYRFGKSSYAPAYPTAGLVYSNGLFYGSTELGGKYGSGTVFSMTPSGKVKVLHNFGHGTDGWTPQCLLLVYHGNIYGTTQYGGANHYGTVFVMSLSGKEQVLHSFTGGSDGAYPTNGLAELNGTLYGTTPTGQNSSTYGTVFAVSP